MSVLFIRPWFSSGWLSIARGEDVVAIMDVSCVACLCGLEAESCRKGFFDDSANCFLVALDFDDNCFKGKDDGVAGCFNGRLRKFKRPVTELIPRIPLS